MARTLMIGLTESGRDARINEDAFLCDGRIYPDMISGREEQGATSNDYHQLYVVAEGFGGPGAGDIAARLVHRVALQLVSRIDAYKNPDFDFRRFATDFLLRANKMIRHQIGSKFDRKVGCSCSLLLIEANTCHALTIGRTGIHLFRDDQIYRLNEHPAEPLKNYLGAYEENAVPVPDMMKKCTLQQGDIFVLSSGGFNRSCRSHQLADTLSRQDAFAATIRQAQIEAGRINPGVNRTVAAVKILDLSLRRPADRSELEATHRTVYNTGIAYEVERKESEMTVPADYRPSGKRKAAVFFKSLLLGFLIGLAILLIVWFFVL